MLVPGSFIPRDIYSACYSFCDIYSGGICNRDIYSDYTVEQMSRKWTLTFQLPSLQSMTKLCKMNVPTVRCYTGPPALSYPPGALLTWFNQGLTSCLQEIEKDFFWVDFIQVNFYLGVFFQWWILYFMIFGLGANCTW